MEKEKIIIKLIELVRETPEVFTRSRTGRPLEGDSLDEFWKRVETDMGDPSMSDADWKKKWKYLRNTFSKIRKRQIENDDEGGNSRAKWIFYDHLLFLKPHIKPQSSPSVKEETPSEIWDSQPWLEKDLLQAVRSAWIPLAGNKGQIVRIQDEECLYLSDGHVMIRIFSEEWSQGSQQSSSQAPETGTVIQLGSYSYSLMATGLSDFEGLCLAFENDELEFLMVIDDYQSVAYESTDSEIPNVNSLPSVKSALEARVAKANDTLPSASGSLTDSNEHLSELLDMLGRDSDSSEMDTASTDKVDFEQVVVSNAQIAPLKKLAAQKLVIIPRKACSEQTGILGTSAEVHGSVDDSPDLAHKTPSNTPLVLEKSPHVILRRLEMQHKTSQGNQRCLSPMKMQTPRAEVRSMSTETPVRAFQLINGQPLKTLGDDLSLKSLQCQPDSTTGANGNAEDNRQAGRKDSGKGRRSSSEDFQSISRKAKNTNILFSKSSKLRCKKLNQKADIPTESETTEMKTQLQSKSQNHRVGPVISCEVNRRQEGLSKMLSSEVRQTKVRDEPSETLHTTASERRNSDSPNDFSYQRCKLMNETTLHGLVASDSQVKLIKAVPGWSPDDCSSSTIPKVSTCLKNAHLSSCVHPEPATEVLYSRKSIHNNENSSLPIVDLWKKDTGSGGFPLCAEDGTLSLKRCPKDSKYTEDPQSPNYSEELSGSKGTSPKGDELSGGNEGSGSLFSDVDDNQFIFLTSSGSLELQPGSHDVSKAYLYISDNTVSSSSGVSVPNMPNSRPKYCLSLRNDDSPPPPLDKSGDKGPSSSVKSKTAPTSARRVSMRNKCKNWSSSDDLFESLSPVASPSKEKFSLIDSCLKKWYLGTLAVDLNQSKRSRYSIAITNWDGKDVQEIRMCRNADRVASPDRLAKKKRKK
ncbi:uncharacterized protein LOC101850325 isoform X1 [Aplysia californica]|uniref:Uncharacterized protein LOC101850325 isoform X1 n=1 Tax=Aplysia californica TaxID=6500 RepID=A0ABM0ZXW1_APLCA|nr:uncharacterized protein LOC101850325 isoform X1 [Aplysia californica]XP_012936756.1 uncharacterized protein LOC101850325 isoform X1 [Aplysia californica]